MLQYQIFVSNTYNRLANGNTSWSISVTEAILRLRFLAWITVYHRRKDLSANVKFMKEAGFLIFVQQL